MKETAERFGISERSYQLLIDAIERRPDIERVLIFGSRATGTAKTGSDIDLALLGENATEETAGELSRELNERLPIPYYIDVLVYDRISHEPLRRHIDQYGRELYRRAEG
jgi:predicted nucleotidyltransferase